MVCGVPPFTGPCESLLQNPNVTVSTYKGDWRRTWEYVHGLVSVCSVWSLCPDLVCSSFQELCIREVICCCSRYAAVVSACSFFLSRKSMLPPFQTMWPFLQPQLLYFKKIVNVIVHCDFLRFLLFSAMHVLDTFTSPSPMRQHVLCPQNSSQGPATREEVSIRQQCAV